MPGWPFREKVRVYSWYGEEKVSTWVLLRQLVAARPRPAVRLSLPGRWRHTGRPQQEGFSGRGK